MKVFISGYGRMGKMVEFVLKSRNIECSGVSEDITSADKAVASESVCIDFTVPEAFRANYRFIAENFKAAVVGTTGWYDIADEVFAYFENAVRLSFGLPISRSVSMSSLLLWTWFPSFLQSLAAMPRI